MNQISDTRKLKLGVLGGGQLGKMLIQAAIDFDLHVKVLDPNPEAPCSGLAHEFQCGSLMDEQTVWEFGQGCDVLTIEIEHINTLALEKLRKQGVKVYPDPTTLRMVQDKRQQKSFYQQQGFPTSPFWKVDAASNLASFAAELPLVYKTAFAGYDGKGVHLVPSGDLLTHDLPLPGLLEKKVAIEKELAIITARNPSGDISVFPAIEMVFHPEGNLVEYLISPPEVEGSILRQAEQIALNLTQALNFVGLLAVEMFLSTSGELLINEIAPRPHNSGHHTIKANMTSQFEQHLRAILDLPLGKTDLLTQGAMVNILGDPAQAGAPIYEGLEEILALPGVYVHLYGKKESRPFRKMGHITILHPEREGLIELVQKVRNSFRVRAK